MPINQPNKHDTPAMETLTAPQPGTAAPDFTAQTTTGKTVHLGDFHGKKLVLYFYPKDDTPGCTVETCGLRDQYQKIRELGAEVLGVSVDGVESHRNFTEKFHVPFQLLAEQHKRITKAYVVFNDKQ